MEYEICFENKLQVLSLLHETLPGSDFQYMEGEVINKHKLGTYWDEYYGYTPTWATTPSVTEVAIWIAEQSMKKGRVEKAVEIDNAFKLVNRLNSIK